MKEDPQPARSRKGQKVRVPLRRNRTRPARKRDWTHQPTGPDGEEVDTVRSENIVAKGHLSRHRTVVVHEGSDTLPPGLRRGRVTAVCGPVAEVHDGQQVYECTVRRVLRTRLIAERNPITVGDRVRFRLAREGDNERSTGVIEEVEPRYGQLRRKAGKRVHMIAANIDQAVVVSSVDLPPLKPHLIDRYLVASHAGDIAPVICINKTDLDVNGVTPAVCRRYQRLGYRVLLTSAETGAGIEQLADVLTDRTSVLVGQSGVGKSSLLNAIDPGLRLKTGEISEQVGKGRHTTSTARLLRVKTGGFVVDTPGIRSFDVSPVPRYELEAYFTDFLQHIPGCKFPDCTHTHETHCAVKDAVEAGLIHPARYASYVRMFEDAADETL